MKKQKTVNTVHHNDEFSSGLMEQYGQWMGGKCFQNTDPVDLNLHEAPFDGMDAQSNGAEIEDITKKKKSAKKESPKKQLATKEDAEYGYDKKGNSLNPKDKKKKKEVLEREEYEIDGEIYVIEKIKMDGVDDNGNTSCWKGYKKQGTKKKGGKEVNNCVKAGDELEHDGEQLDEYGKVKKKKKSNKYVSEHHKTDADGNVIPHEEEAAGTPSSVEEIEEKKKLDPVGKEDKDIDNDGDHDKSDKFLIARRKKVSKIIGMTKKKK